MFYRFIVSSLDALPITFCPTVQNFLPDRNNAGETPLYHALLNGHFEVACFLLRHGADAADALNMKDAANFKGRPTESGVASNHRRRQPQSGAGDAGMNGRRRGASQTGSRAARRAGERIPRGAMPSLRRHSREEEEEEEEEEEREEEEQEEEEGVRETGGRFVSESQPPTASPLIAAVEDSLNLNFFKVSNRTEINSFSSVAIYHLDEIFCIAVYCCTLSGCNISSG